MINYILAILLTLICINTLLLYYKGKQWIAVLKARDRELDILLKLNKNFMEEIMSLNQTIFKLEETAKKNLNKTQSIE
jgi:hypothetical protein